MASAIMNAIKEEVTLTGASVASTSTTIATTGRTAVSRSIATAAPSASARVAASHIGPETGTLLAGAIRSETINAARVQPVLGDLNVAAAESSVLSSTLGQAANAETNGVRNVLPELREQISQAVQQGFEELAGDHASRLDPSLGIAETAQKLEEIAAAR